MFDLPQHPLRAATLLCRRKEFKPNANHHYVRSHFYFLFSAIFLSLFWIWNDFKVIARALNGLGLRNNGSCTAYSAYVLIKSPAACRKTWTPKTSKRTNWRSGCTSSYPATSFALHSHLMTDLTRRSSNRKFNLITWCKMLKMSKRNSNLLIFGKRNAWNYMNWRFTWCCWWYWCECNKEEGEFSHIN